MTDILVQADAVFSALGQLKCSHEVSELVRDIQETTLRRLFVVSAITDACLQKREKFAGASSLGKLDFCDRNDIKGRVNAGESVTRLYTEFRSSFYPRGSSATLAETVCAAADTLYSTRLETLRKTQDPNAEIPPSFSRDRTSFITVLALLDAKVNRAELGGATSKQATKESLPSEVSLDFGEIPKFPLAERRLLPRASAKARYARKIRLSQ